MANVETKTEEVVETKVTEEVPVEEAPVKEVSAEAVTEKAETATETKEKKGVDVNKVVDSAKNGVNTANRKVTDFFTGNGKRSKWVLFIFMVLEALLAFNAGFLNFLICAILTLVGFIGLSAAIPSEKENKEKKSE